MYAPCMEYLPTIVPTKNVMSFWWWGRVDPTYKLFPFTSWHCHLNHEKKTGWLGKYKGLSYPTQLYSGIIS